jgi:hypothetical protein
MTATRQDVVLQLLLFDAYVKHAQALPPPAISDALKHFTAVLGKQAPDVAAVELQRLAAVFAAVSTELGTRHAEPDNT